MVVAQLATRGPRFESRHRQNFIMNIFLFTVEKTKIKKKRQEWPIFLINCVVLKVCLTNCFNEMVVNFN